MASEFALANWSMSSFSPEMRRMVHVQTVTKKQRRDICSWPVGAPSGSSSDAGTPRRIPVSCVDQESVPTSYLVKVLQIYSDGRA